MEADQIVVRVDILGSEAGRCQSSADVVRNACRRLTAQTILVRLSSVDPNFDVSGFVQRVDVTVSGLTRAARQMDADADLMIRSAREAEVADAGPLVVGRSFMFWKKIPDLPGWPLNQLEIPDDPRWYLATLGLLHSQFERRRYVSAGACVGVCIGTSVQDGVVTLSRGAGLAYSIGIDGGLRYSTIDNGERDLSYQEDRFFVSGPGLGFEMTRTVLPPGDGDSGREAGWDWAVAGSLSPMPFGGGWVRQWNQRHDLRRRESSEDDK